MKELVLTGRGGQGVVLASQLLADTLARAGYWVQSFPEFKPERRGAPISAFLRWDDSSPIHRRYKVRECDVLVAISTSLPAPWLIRSVKPGGLIVLNRETRFLHTGPFDVARVPASHIARRLGILSSEGRPMGNTAVLGACVKLLLPDGLPLLEQAIASRMGTLAEANIAAAAEGYARCRRQRPVAGDTPIEAVPAGRASEPRPTPGAFAGTTMDSLRIRTGSWSEERPVLTDKCNACALCVLFCPEGAIARTDGVMSIDESYCKGCGICEAVCPVRNAIRMEEVPV